MDLNVRYMFVLDTFRLQSRIDECVICQLVFV